MGDTILRAWGIEPLADVDPELFALVKQRTAVLHDAWLNEVGHQRPGIPAGLPIDQANAKAKELEKQIEEKIDTGS